MNKNYFKFVNKDYSEFVLFVPLFIVVLFIIGILHYTHLTEDNYIDIIVEAHGLLFDIFLFGLILTWYRGRISKGAAIEMHQEKLDDLGYWNADEATWKAVGIIKRLNRLEAKINMKNLHLKKGILDGITFKNCSIDNVDFSDTKFNNITFTEVTIEQISCSDAEWRNIKFLNCKINFFANITKEGLSNYEKSIEDSDKKAEKDSQKSFYEKICEKKSGCTEYKNFITNMKIFGEPKSKEDEPKSKEDELKSKEDEPKSKEDEYETCKVSFKLENFEIKNCQTAKNLLFINSDFIEGKLCSTNFTNVCFIEGEFKKIKIEKTTFKHVIFHLVTFDTCDFEDKTFENCLFVDVTFKNCTNITGNTLFQCNIVQKLTFANCKVEKKTFPTNMHKLITITE